MTLASGSGVRNFSFGSPSSDNDLASDETAFAVEIKISNPADFFWNAAEAYLDMFGVTRTDEVLSSWTLFANQYSEEKADNYILKEAQNFRKQPYFQAQNSIPNVRDYTLQINVPKSFIDALRNFGIEVSFNPAFKEVTITKFDPIKMIEWSDLQPADIFCVGGVGIASKIIRMGTWTFSSHTAFYEGNDFVIESLARGITRRTKAEFLSPGEGVNLILVKRHRSAGSAKKVVRAARDNVNAGVPPYGKHPVKYNWLGLAGAGMSSTSGKAIATAFPAVSVVEAIDEVKDAARKAVNLIPEDLEISPGGSGAIIMINKKVWGGYKNRMFCTEAVIYWFNQGGIPITPLKPDSVPPKFIAEHNFDHSLQEVGYLRYMP